MARPPPRRVNGTRTTFMPLTPDSILLHHIIQTQSWHTQEIVRLSTQISTMQKRSRPLPWRELMPGLWGIVLLVLLVMVATGRLTISEAMALLGRV